MAHFLLLSLAPCLKDAVDIMASDSWVFLLFLTWY